jgi:hypothetical protein
MENKIDELEFLMNPALFDKWMLSKQFDKTIDYKTDLKFYKKRILQLTRDMCKGVEMTPSLDKCFGDYVRCCIVYLKCLDRKDILQEEYKGINTEMDQTGEGLYINMLKSDGVTTDLDMDNLINPVYTEQKTTLRDFLDIKTISTIETIREKIPQQKKVQLDKEEFKTKGVSKNLKNKKRGGKRKS